MQGPGLEFPVSLPSLYLDCGRKASNRGARTGSKSNILPAARRNCNTELPGHSNLLYFSSTASILNLVILLFNEAASRRDQSEPAAAPTQLHSHPPAGGQPGSG